MATMTMAEAESILDIVSVALQDTSHRHYSVSALKGYDIYQIRTALKLRIANELLHLAHRDDFDEQFADGLKIYSGIPWSIMRFVPGDQVDSLMAEGVFNPLDHPSTMTWERFDSVETETSFGDYCRSLGTDDPIYWQKVYTRIGLEYTSTSPKGNTAWRMR